MSEPQPDRNQEIYRKAMEGKSQIALGEEYKISAPRVSQIVRQVGRARHGQLLTIGELRRREREDTEIA